MYRNASPAPNGYGYGTIQPTEVDSSDTPTVHNNGEIPSQNPSPLWTARKLLVFCLLCFVYFLTWSYVGLLAPFFPNEAKTFGINSTEIGLIFGIYSLVAFLTSFVYGSFLVPKMGPYFVLFCGLFLNAGATITFGFLNLLPKGQIFAVFCLVTRGVSALGGSGCETAVMVILIQEFRENLPLVIGLLEIFTGLGFTVGPVVGGALYSLGGFRLPLLVIGGLLLFALPMVWLFLPRSYIEITTRDKAAWKEAIVIPGVIVMCITLFVGVSAIAFLDPTLEPHAEKFGLNSTDVGLLFLVFSGFYMTGAPFIGRILQTKDWRRYFVVTGFFLVSVCLLLVGPAPFLSPYIPQRKVWMLVLSMGLAGASNSFYFVPIIPEILQCSHERGMAIDMHTDAMASGLYTGFSNLGGFVGPFVGGLLTDYLTFEWTATILSGLVFLQALVLCTFFSCFRRKESGQRKMIDPEVTS